VYTHTGDGEQLVARSLSHTGARFGKTPSDCAGTPTVRCICSIPKRASGSTSRVSQLNEQAERKAPQ